MALFSITCETCQARLKVRSASALGQIVACPKCGSMVQVVAPHGWTAPAAAPLEAAPADEGGSSPEVPDEGEEVFATASAELASGRLWRLWLAVGALGTVAILAGLWWTLARETPDTALAPAARGVTDSPPPDLPATVEKTTQHDASAEGPEGKVGDDGAGAEPSSRADNPSSGDDWANRDSADGVSADRNPGPVDSAQRPASVRPGAAARDGDLPVAEVRPSTDVAVTPAPRAANPATATGAVVGEGAAAPGQPVPAPAPEPAPERSPDVRTRLATPLNGLRFEQVALADVLATLSQLGGVPIVLDVQSVPDAGRMAGTRITENLRDTTVGAAAAASVRKLGLEGVISRSQVILVPRGMRPGRPVARTYDLADLVEAVDAEELAALRAFLMRLARAREGPPASDAATSLELTAPPAGHRLVAEALARLREARAKSQPVSAGAMVPPLGDRLARPVTLTFARPAPLGKVLRDLEIESQARILVDWPALEQAGVGPQLEVTLKAHEQPISAALDALSEPRGLGWAALDEQTLLLTSAAGTEGLWQVRGYPSRGFGRMAEDAGTVEGLVRARTSAGYWQAADGAPVCWLDAASGTVLIAGPAGLHVELAALRAP